MNSIQRSGQKIQIEVAGGCYVVHWEILAGAVLFESLRDDQVIVLDEEKFLQGAGNQNSPETMDLRQQDEASKTPRLLHGFHQDHYLRNEKFMDLDELKYVFGATEGAHMNEIEGSTNVAYFLRTVPAAIVAYLDYETWCTSARPITFARADRTVSLFSSLRLIDFEGINTG